MQEGKNCQQIEPVLDHQGSPWVKSNPYPLGIEPSFGDIRAIIFNWKFNDLPKNGIAIWAGIDKQVS